MDERTKFVGGMKPNLLPCPFCGGESYFTASVNGNQMVYAGCAACGIAFKAQRIYDPSGEYLTKDVVATWNRRAAPASREAEEP